MNATPEEVAAARRLAEAFLDLLLAVERGAAARRPAPPKPDIPRFNPATVPAPPAYLSRLDAAKYLGVHPNTVANRTAPRGPIPATKIGTLVRYKQTDLDAFAETMKIRPR